MTFTPQRARKIGGSYQADGTIVSSFKTLSGEQRYVFEFDVPNGMLHIFSPAQVEILDPVLLDPEASNKWRRAVHYHCCLADLIFNEAVPLKMVGELIESNVKAAIDARSCISKIECTKTEAEISALILNADENGFLALSWLDENNGLSTKAKSFFKALGVLK